MLAYLLEPVEVLVEEEWVAPLLEVLEILLLLHQAKEVLAAQVEGLVDKAAVAAVAQAPQVIMRLLMLEVTAALELQALLLERLLLMLVV